MFGNSPPPAKNNAQGFSFGYPTNDANADRSSFGNAPQSSNVFGSSPPTQTHQSNGFRFGSSVTSSSIVERPLFELCRADETSSPFGLRPGFGSSSPLDNVSAKPNQPIKQEEASPSAFGKGDIVIFSLPTGDGRNIKCLLEVAGSVETRVPFNNLAYSLVAMEPRTNYQGIVCVAPKSLLEKRVLKYKVGEKFEIKLGKFEETLIAEVTAIELIQEDKIEYEMSLSNRSKILVVDDGI